MLTDDDIAALGPRERAELIRRLSRPLAEVGVTTTRLQHARQLRLTLMIASAIVLVPWTIYLALTLPHTYRAHNWNLAWVGFDLILLALTLSTLVLGLRRRVLVIPLGFATGILVACDAWFDVWTASPADVGLSIGTALLLEVPLAVLMLGGGLQVMRVVAQRLWLIEPGQHLWQARIPAP